MIKIEKIIENILEQNKELFGENAKYEKINVGFTNTIYIVNNMFIVKICTNPDNEKNFEKEIKFYKANINNDLIPKLYYSNVEKDIVPYYYEIIKKIEGVSLYNVWHTFDENQREDVIRQLCDAMKQFHSNIGARYNWTKKTSELFMSLYNKAKELNLFNNEEQELIENAYSEIEVSRVCDPQYIRYLQIRRDFRYFQVLHDREYDQKQKRAEPDERKHEQTHIEK